VKGTKIDTEYEVQHSLTLTTTTPTFIERLFFHFLEIKKLSNTLTQQ